MYMYQVDKNNDKMSKIFLMLITLLQRIYEIRIEVKYWQNYQHFQFLTQVHLFMRCENPSIVEVYNCGLSTFCIIRLHLLLNSYQVPH